METLFEDWELFRKSMFFDTAFSGYSRHGQCERGQQCENDEVSIQKSWKGPLSQLNLPETHAREGRRFLFEKLTLLPAI